MLSWTLGCNAITRAATEKQIAEPSNPPPFLARGETRSLVEQEEQASRIFEERRLAIQQERQALDNSCDRFLTILTAHPAMVDQPIARNEPEVRDFLGGDGTNEVRPVATNHRIISRCSTTPPPGDHRNQVSAPARSIAVAVLVEGLADRRLEKVEVQSLQQYNRSPSRGVRRGRSPLRAGIADRQDPGRCPDLGAGGQGEPWDLLPLSPFTGLPGVRVRLDPEKSLGTFFPLLPSTDLSTHYENPKSTYNQSISNSSIRPTY